MSETSRAFERLQQGELLTTDELLPIVYTELKRLASRQLIKEPSGHSLQTTALVHEAYVRLVGSDQEWEGRGHFFAAAAESMRRILVDRARKKQRVKRGGKNRREHLDENQPSKGPAPEEVILVDDLLDSLAEKHPRAADIAKLRYFAGFNVSEAGKALEMNGSAAHKSWTFAKAWLHREMKRELPGGLAE